MKIILSFDDGTPEDERLLRILDKLDLKAIFFIPIQSWGYMNLDKYAGHEIGSHTLTHPQDLKLLSNQVLKSEIDVSRRTLQSHGHKVEWFCYPRGRHDERVREYVKDAGYKYARTTIIGHIEDLDEYDPYQVHTSIHLGYDRPEYGDEDWLTFANRMLKKAKDENGTLHCWGHSAEIDREKQWDNVELFLSKL